MNPQSLRFEGRVAVVTGGGCGLGRAVAKALAERGAHVVVNDFGVSVDGAGGGDAGPATAVVDEIHASGGEAAAVVSDIGTEEGVRETLAAALDRFGRCDIIVHAASPVLPMAPFEEATREGRNLSLRVNAFAAWELAQQAWPLFKQQKYGRIVLIHSAAGYWGRSGMPAYSMAKSAMTAFAKYLATEGEPHGIRVNCLAPVVHTRAWQGQSVPEALEALAPAESVAQAVALLAHENCPVSGELFHAVGNYLTRVFIAQTQGYQFESGMAEDLLERFSSVMDHSEFLVPKEANAAGAAIFATITGQEPELGQGE